MTYYKGTWQKPQGTPRKWPEEELKYLEISTGRSRACLNLGSWQESVKYSPRLYKAISDVGVKSMRQERGAGLLVPSLVLSCTSCWSRTILASPQEVDLVLPSFIGGPSLSSRLRDPFRLVILSHRSLDPESPPISWIPPHSSSVILRWPSHLIPDSPGCSVSFL